MPKGRADEAALTADIVALASEYGRYGYRRITAMLQAAGWPPAPEVVLWPAMPADAAPPTAPTVAPKPTLH